MTRHDIRPAQRIENVSEYYFSRKLKEIARLNEGGADIISLGIGGPDLPPPTEAVNAAVATLEDPHAHGYQMTVGLPDLRRSYAGWYRRWYGVTDLDPDTQVLPLIGSKEGVLNIALAFLNPGDRVLVPNPGYPTYTSASRLAGAIPVYYDLTEENGWLPDFEALDRMVTDDIKVMWVNYPHMPTGTPATIALYDKLVQFGRRHGILIVNDNPYSFIRNPHPISIMQINGAQDTALEMNSLSKCLNMPGWRLGMVVGASRYISWILRVKSNIDSGQPKAMMAGAIEALKVSSSWYETLNHTYERRSQIALRIMKALGCHCSEGQQGLFVWGRIPDEASCSEMFADEILSTARVFVTPGFIFGSCGDRYIRISLCEPEDLLSEALRRITETFNK